MEGELNTYGAVRPVFKPWERYVFLNKLNEYGEEFVILVDHST